MSYSKRFFLALTIVLACALLAAGVLVGDWLPAWALWDWWLVAICIAAMAERVSGGLAEGFARLTGRLILTPAGTSLARFVLARNIQPVETTRTTAGIREVRYVDFGYDKVLEAMNAKGVKPTELLLNAEGFREYLDAAKYQVADLRFDPFAVV